MTTSSVAINAHNDNVD